MFVRYSRQKGGMVFRVTPGHHSVPRRFPSAQQAAFWSGVLVLDRRQLGCRHRVRARSRARLRQSRAQGMELEARHVMTRDVVTLRSDDSIEPGDGNHDPRRFRPPAGVRHGFVGLVSSATLVKARLEEAEARDRGAQGLHLAG